MSATRRYLFPSALMLVLILTMAASASGQGIWSYEYRTDGAYKHTADNITLSIVNLTSRRLVVKSPAQGTSFYLHCQQYSLESVCHSAQAYPFQEASSTLYDDPDWQASNNTLYIYPYRSATWASRISTVSSGDYAWGGQVEVYPEGSFGSGSDAIPGDRLTVYVNANSQEPTAGDNPILNRNHGRGVWWYLQAKDTSVWSSTTSNYFEGIYVTPFELTLKYNVMTMTGAQLTASLFDGGDSRPDLASNHPVLVIREHLGVSTNALDQSQTVLPYQYTPQIGGTSPSSMQQVGQIVTAGQSGVLDHVSIYADSMQTTSPGPVPLVTATIQTVSNGLPSGTVIGSGAIPITDLPAGSSWQRNPQWVTFKLSSVGGASLAMTPGTQYAIVVSAGGGIITWYGSGDVYAGGSMVFPYTSGWGTVPSADFLFQTYIMPNTYNHYMGWALDFSDQPSDSVPTPEQ